MRRPGILCFPLVLGCILVAGPAWALRLHPPLEAHFLVHVGASFLLVSHILGGAVGIVSGVVATAVNKGSKTHRLAGKVFFVSLTLCYLVGALVAPFLSEGQRPNFIAAVLALYLLVSGIRAADRRALTAGRHAAFGLFIALLVTVSGVIFAALGASNDSGTVDGAPPDAFVIFVVFGLLAAVGDYRVLRGRAVAGAYRISRHLWRMCASFFIASGSFFLGQSQALPEWLNETFMPTLFAIYPLLVLVIWLVKVQLSARRESSMA